MIGLEGSIDGHGHGGFVEEQVRDLYDILVKVCAKPDEKVVTRRLAHRSGLDLFSCHTEIFSAYLIDPGAADKWYHNLKQWAFSFNKDDSKVWPLTQLFSVSVL